jgi:hypothetical protein
MRSTAGRGVVYLLADLLRRAGADRERERTLDVREADGLFDAADGFFFLFEAIDSRYSAKPERSGGLSFGFSGRTASSKCSSALIISFWPRTDYASNKVRRLASEGWVMGTEAEGM